MLLASEGQSNKQIARHLGVVEGTIKMHLHNVYQKTAISNRTGLAALAISYRHVVCRLEPPEQMVRRFDVVGGQVRLGERGVERPALERFQGMSPQPRRPGARRAAPSRDLLDDASEARVRPAHCSARRCRCRSGRRPPGPSSAGPGLGRRTKRSRGRSRRPPPHRPVRYSSCRPDCL